MINSENPPANPMVSICMITYNQAAFISEAIEGIIKQKTDFIVELIIGEDCSTDKTRYILNEYEQRYPDKIRILYHEKHLGLAENTCTTLKACHGKYVALCDSDDYWTDPNKLVKQVNYLESHPECAICFHPALDFNPADHTFSKHTRFFAKDITGLRELLSLNYLQTSTVLFRNGFIIEYPDWFFKTIFNDWCVHLLNAQHGNIGYIDEYMAVYRIQPSGVWTSRDNAEKCRMVIDFLLLIKSHFGKRYHPSIRSGLAREYIMLSSIYADRGDLASAKVCLLKSIQSKFFAREKGLDQAVMLTRLYFPIIYRMVKRLFRRV